jgi:indolepyruvate ferredoxin oxidoreductase
VPLGEAALLRAIELNGAAVDMNKAAFAWGRQAAIDIAPVRAAAGMAAPAAVVAMPQRTPSLEVLIADRSDRLTAYQNAAYAKRYVEFVRAVADAERQRVGGDRLAREVATSLYKLMAYKDEYEVARLYAESGFFDRVAQQFEGDYKLRFHLAPPLLARRDSQGHLVKQAYGPWVAGAMRWLAKARVLRGTPFDPLGYMAERRAERQAIDDFQALMRRVLGALDAQRLDTALALARLPQTVRGYGHVKHQQASAAALKQQALWGEFVRGPATVAETRQAA